MHNLLDQYSKNLLRDALTLVSKVADTEVEVLAATQKIDVYATPDPAREHERPQLGLLGELSSEPSLYEPFSSTPSLGRVRRCFNKQLGWHHELERRARVAAGQSGDDEDNVSQDEPPELVTFPTLVVISPGRPETVLEVYAGEQVRPGVYALVKGLCTFVVVTSELPRTRETLLFRLMGRGRVLADALLDMKALPPDALERCIATPLLVHFRFEQVITKEDEPMSAEIRAWFDDYQRKLRDEGRNEGVNEGLIKGERLFLLRLLRARFGDVPATAMMRIEAADNTQLETWGERVLSARTLDEVLDGAN